jgi:glycosyltransferase involved in cell wall biosynthesis
MSLTIAILSKDYNLEKQFLERANFADEIIIICSDQVLKDRITGKVKIFYRSLNNDFASQRNFALSKAKSDWVLFIDTDEIISNQLASEITEAIKSSKFSGYLLRRLDTCDHQVVLHGETGNIKILRLAKTKSGKFNRSVHEQWQIKGKIGELQNPLFHTKDKFISEFLSRIGLYGPIDAINLNKENKPFNFFRLLAYPKAKFILNYFFKLGFLDGLVGLFQAYLLGVQSLSVRVFQWTIKKQSTV